MTSVRVLLKPNTLSLAVKTTRFTSQFPLLLRNGCFMKKVKCRSTFFSSNLNPDIYIYLGFVISTPWVKITSLCWRFDCFACTRLFKWTWTANSEYNHKTNNSGQGSQENNNDNTSRVVNSQSTSCTLRLVSYTCIRY